MNKKFIVIFLLAFGNCLAQNPVYPVRDGTMNLGNPTGDFVWYTYTPVMKEGNLFKLYFVSSGVPKLGVSTNGKNWTLGGYPSSTRQESIVKKNNTWYMGYHKTNVDSNYFYTCQSPDGLNFTKDTARFYCGDDLSLMVNNDSFFCYIRPKIPNHDPLRKIGLTKSADFSHWTPIQTILEVDSADYNNPNSPDFRKQFYYMSVFKNGADWWGLLGVLRVGDNGEDVEQLPPYTTLEHTVETQLVYSTDGVNWQRTNNRNAFIPRVTGIMEVFGLPTIVSDSLWIYTIESKRRHTDYEYSNVNGRYFGIWRYKISLNDLNKWKPVTHVNLTLAIEGLLNSSGRHNSIDSATIYIRSKSFPYAVMDSAVSKIDSVTLKADFSLSRVTTDSYYIAVKGANFIETWSKYPVMITQTQTNSLNFTTSLTTAYGNNLVPKFGKYCLYSGDLDNNGIIELVDVLTTFNDADSFSTGNLITDLNGDQIVDLNDLNIVNSNAGRFISKKRP